jgi:cobalt-zinc-cadmium efflux system membrane fusion protein
VSVETPDSAVAGTVRSITPGVNAESRAATVIVTLLGDTSRFRPGQAVRVQITPRASAIGSGRIVVPEEAVQSVGGRDVVFARTAKGFQALPVTVGARGGGRAEIESGLKAGQAIAGKGAFLLKAEIGKGEAEEE